MKNEAAFWGAVRKRLVDAGWLAWKVPAEIRKGLPDVFLGKNGGSAWVELKYRPRWPARDDTPVHVDVSPEQHAHLRDLRAADLDGFVLLGVEDDVFILDDIAPMQKKTRAQLLAGHGRCSLADLPARLLARVYSPRTSALDE